MIYLIYKAAEKGYIAIARLLLSNGADVNCKDNSGETPLDEGRSIKIEINVIH